jgi:hypothetical protein
MKIEGIDWNDYILIWRLNTTMAFDNIHLLSIDKF